MLNCLDDNKPAENVLQDLALANALPPSATAAVLEIEKEFYVGKIPTAILPAKRNDFTLYVANEDDVVRAINNLLKSLALTVENVGNSNTGHLILL